MSVRRCADKPKSCNRPALQPVPPLLFQGSYDVCPRLPNTWSQNAVVTP